MEAVSDVATQNEMQVLLAAVTTESGANLLALAEASPVLLVFLRHFGCAFCRKSISDIAGLQNELAARGVRPVFVHLGPLAIAKAHFDYYGLSDVERIHDPQAALYQAPVFGLARTSKWSHFLVAKVWKGGLGGTRVKHGIGKLGDADQMPGVFFVRDGKIARRFVHRTIADEPDYLGMVV
jgi:hypothetical protein